MKKQFPVTFRLVRIILRNRIASLNLATLKIRYAIKMLAMPIGTRFEYLNKPVNRFAYIRNTLKLLKNI